MVCRAFDRARQRCRADLALVRAPPLALSIGFLLGELPDEFESDIKRSLLRVSQKFLSLVLSIRPNLRVR